MPGTVLVTGGAGYIGSHACKALARAGHAPVTYDNLSTGNRWAVRWGPLEIGDVTDAARLTEVVRRYRPTGILHFAALALVGESMAEPALYYRTNVGGLVSVLDAARAGDIGGVVFSSTCAVYGTPPAGPIVEATPAAPINPYGASKLMAERVLADYDAAYGLPYMALRYFNAAGADPEAEIGELRAVETHLVPLAIDSALGRRPPLRILGTDYPTPDGTAVRDYVHVADLALAHVRALEHLLGGGGSRVLNLGSGAGHSVRQVVETVERHVGRLVPRLEHPRRPGDPPVLVADPGAARALLGEDVCGAFDLDAIVATALAWHRSERFTRFALP